MNGRMAVQAGTGKHPVGWGTALKGIKFSVDAAGMTAGVMATLAELGHPVRKELPVIAAVNGMTG